VQIGAGTTFTLCLDDRGSLWMFGEGPCVAGAFGSPSAVHEPRPIPAEALGGRSVLAASCGDGHVLLLTAWDPHHCLLQPGAWYAEGVGRRSSGCVGVEDVVLGEWTP